MLYTFEMYATTSTSGTPTGLELQNSITYLEQERFTSIRLMKKYPYLTNSLEK